ncbi:Cytochrome P450 3A40 [Orchesella cincta]|uniref:Cytochrome P450 3A40 n=1 Tax=Orchesella cincta TaxID=48709 RepID=A0A1D2MMC4_ORCCI|nr:Cytochrome P450 3A40 [Orchesella cincta]
MAFYEGRTPQVHICDPELVKQILIRDYDYFSNRKQFNLGNPIANEILDFQPEVKWKYMRAVMTPLFAPSRIRHMAEILQSISEEHVDNLKSNFTPGSGPMKFEFRSYLGSLLTDVIGRCYLNITFNDRLDPNSHFLQLLKDLIREYSDYDIKHELIRSFPFLTWLHPIMPSKALSQFKVTLLNIIKARNASSPNKLNMGQGLHDLLSKLDNPDLKSLGMNENTGVALALEAFLATFDSVGNPLCFLAYFLAKNPPVQDKLLKEVDEIFERSSSENIFHDMRYLQACIQEMFRLIPPFFRLERECTKDWRNEEKGLTIKKGTVVIIPVWPLNRHPDHYENPEDFIPERFLNQDNSKNSTYAFATFGHGPKNCVGQKWSYEMSAIIMATFLKQFRFQLSNQGRADESHIKWKPGSSFILKFEPIVLEIVSRT